MEVRGTSILETQRKGLRKRLSNFKNGFLFDRTNIILPEYNIDEYEEKIIEQSRKIVENNSGMKTLLERIEDIVTKEGEE